MSSIPTIFNDKKFINLLQERFTDLISTFCNNLPNDHLNYKNYNNNINNIIIHYPFVDWYENKDFAIEIIRKTMTSASRRLKENDIMALYKFYEENKSIDEDIVFKLSKYWIYEITPSSQLMCLINKREEGDSGDDTYIQLATKTYPIITDNMIVYDMIIDPEIKEGERKYIVLIRTKDDIYNDILNYK
jgi:hypothetical protein